LQSTSQGEDLPDVRLVRSDVAWVSGDHGRVYKTQEASSLDAEWVAVPADRFLDLAVVEQHDFLGIEYVPTAASSQSSNAPSLYLDLQRRKSCES
jgi:hypothetical protein